MSQHRQQPSAAPKVGQWVVMLPGDRGNRAHTQRSHALRLRLTGCSRRRRGSPIVSSGGRHQSRRIATARCVAADLALSVEGSPEWHSLKTHNQSSQYPGDRTWPQDQECIDRNTTGSAKDHRRHGCH
jgi:hypothetical protein